MTEAPGTSPRAAGESGVVRTAGSTLLRVGGVFITVIIVMAIFAVASDGKTLIPANVLGMLRAMSSIAILGLGLLVVIVVGEIDLSFANLYGLSASTMAVVWIVWEWPVWWAIGVAFLVAIFWGTFNAFFTAVTRIPSFIATLGSATLIFGMTLFITETQRFNYLFPDPTQQIDPGQVEIFRGLANQALPSNFPMQALWMIGIAIVFWFLMNRSLFGFRLKAIGGNPEAARLARLPVTKYKFAAFIIAACMACTAALLDFSFIGSAQPTAGQQLLFPTFAAVIIGGASLAGGRGSVVGTLAGALLLAVLANGVALLAAGPFAQQVLLGTVTIGAVLLDQFTQRRRGLI